MFIDLNVGQLFVSASHEIFDDSGLFLDLCLELFVVLHDVIAFGLLDDQFGIKFFDHIIVVFLLGAAIK